MKKLLSLPKKLKFWKKNQTDSEAEKLNKWEIHLKALVIEQGIWKRDIVSLK